MISPTQTASALSGTSSKAELALVEYSSLKQEQSVRIALRETALYIQAGLIVSILSGVSLEDLSEQEIRFGLISAVSFIMFFIYFISDSYINRIRKYIRERLAQQIQVDHPDHSGPRIEVFGWEHFHREDRRAKIFSDLLTSLVLAIVFVAPPMLWFAARVWTCSAAVPVLDWFSGITALVCAVGLMVLRWPRT